MRRLSVGDTKARLYACTTVLSTDASAGQVEGEVSQKGTKGTKSGGKCTLCGATDPAGWWDDDAPTICSDCVGRVQGGKQAGATKLILRMPANVLRSICDFGVLADGRRETIRKRIAEVDGDGKAGVSATKATKAAKGTKDGGKATTTATKVTKAAKGTKGGKSAGKSQQAVGKGDEVLPPLTPEESAIPNPQSAIESGVCKYCGCTEDKACMPEGHPCSWADVSETVCTACVEQMSDIVLGVRTVATVAIDECTSVRLLKVCQDDNLKGDWRRAMVAKRLKEIEKAGKE